MGIEPKRNGQHSRFVFGACPQLLLSVAASVILAPAFAGPLADGETALRSGDYVIALELLHPLADRGDPKAQMDLALMYMGGLGVNKDLSRAAVWLRKAAERGSTDAQRELGAWYFTGKFGVPKDVNQAVTWLRKVAAQEDLRSITFLADLYQRGVLVPKDIGQALHWYRKGAELGDVRSMIGLGSIYLSGDQGQPKDASQAFHWFSKAAEHGDSGAAELALGDLYRQGEGVSMDKAQALVWYRKAAAKGDFIKAMADARIDSLERGEPLVPPPSPPPANFAALTSQAERGDAQAQTDLGNIYLDSRSVLNDYTKGISWLRKAADQDFVPAENALSNTYCVGYGGTPKDGAQCRSWMHRSADQGSAEAQYTLGLSYFNAIWGFEKDDAQGLQWVQRAADQGYVDAQRELGRSYEHGLHSTWQDFANAILWYRKAADQGDGEAQFALANIYERGEGIPRDTAYALEWYRKAAANTGNSLRQSMARRAIERLETSAAP
jgi:uncharacterized protein